jgi:CRISPR-associated protein Csm5
MQPINSLVLQKPDVFETHQISLQSALIHIGSEVSSLSPFEYVQSGNRIYLPAQDALAKALHQRGCLNDYIKTIEDRSDLTALLSNAFGDTWQQATAPDGRPLFPPQQIDIKWPEQRITDLRPMIRNKFGIPYIPGSSIKGAIRTAIAYHLLKHAERYKVPAQQQLSAIEKQLQASMGDLKRKAKFYDDQAFMNELFCNFNLTYQGKRIQAKQGPNTDFMRAIHVSDSIPLAPRLRERPDKPPVKLNQAIAAEVIVSSHFESDRNGLQKAKFRASLFTEFVYNIRTEFTLSIDHEMLSWFHHEQGMNLPFKSIAELLNLCQEFAQDQWNFDHDYWQSIQNNPNAQGKRLDFDAIRQQYEAETCPHTLRMGWASGLPGTTISLLLPDEQVAQVRDTCGIKAPGFLAPKSRRTVMNAKGEIKHTPGWVKLSVKA